MIVVEAASEDNNDYIGSDNITIERPEVREKDPYLKRILIVDDEPDVTLTFGVGLEGYYYQNNKKRRFEVHTYNDPEVALSKFKPNFYDLLLTDIFMPHMNGLELYQKIVDIDPNIRVCFMSAAEVNIEALREVYPNVSFGCFIQKPVTIDKLVQRLLAEVD
ncbi:MAG TPA: response regulator [Nitrososphaeraceae archaeon]|nr:response regulator [Nitrososphaeraceae archaeon]